MFKCLFFPPSIVTARAVPVHEATRAQRADPEVATAPGATPGLPAAHQRGDRQAAERLVPDPPPDPSLAPSLAPSPDPSLAPGLGPVLLLPLRTNSPVPAPGLALGPALAHVHVPAPPQQTANIEIGTSE